MLLTRFLRPILLTVLAGGLAALLSGCEGTGSDGSYKAYAPIPKDTLDLMASRGTAKEAPILIRAYKKEAELEVWKRKPDGQYVFVKTFPMCRWSGQLGPKKTEGDRQVPEGFYTIAPGQMNPNSHYYLSFNVGYPNAYDRANGASGGSIMVHGICSSAGCFSMTDKQIEEIYAIAREAFAGGQRNIQMQSFPFRMTAENMAKLRLDPNMPFWRELKRGSDYFDVTKAETPVGVCDRHYVFGAVPKAGARFDALESCPPVDEDDAVKAQVTTKQQHDEAEVAELVAKGTKPVRMIYADGGQNPEFTRQFAEVSRPDALAAGVTEIALDDGPKAKAVVIQVAAAKARAKVLLAKGNVESPVGPAATVAAAPLTGPAAVGSPAVKEAEAAPVAVTAHKPSAPAAVARAETPAIFDAAPSAYAATEGKDGTRTFFDKWLSFGAATKPESAPAVASSTDQAVSPVPIPSKAAPVRRRLAAKPLTPAKPAQPQLSTTGASPVPNAVTGRADPVPLAKGAALDGKPAEPRSVLAWMPSFN